MTVPSAEELDSFKYSDLQNLAKSLGLRANLRVWGWRGRPLGGRGDAPRRDGFGTVYLSLCLTFLLSPSSAGKICCCSSNS
uniref:Uncharacterized protein n=1 Tax=Castor canadensis TaxID=51338 RepID=A0A8C0WP76_CASCN